MSDIDVYAQLHSSGFALLQPAQLTALLGIDVAALHGWRDSWERLPSDQYLRDGGHYRFRRHSCFVQELSTAAQHQQLVLQPQRPHWQPTSYNALHGGMQRRFEPIEATVTGTDAWSSLIGGIGAIFARVATVNRWYIEAHQFRIDTAQGIGRPTPEGAHRDGVDFVAVILVHRQQVRGGETRVFDAHGTGGVRFTMTDPWTGLLLDDARVIHETTPILPDGPHGYRDTLVITYRKNGFQAPDAS